MKSYIKFNPVRTIAALSGLAKAVIALVALKFGWDPETIVAVGGVESAAMIVFGTLFVEAKTASTAALDALVQAGQQVSPEAVDLLTDVAQDALRGEGNTALRG